MFKGYLKNRKALIKGYSLKNGALEHQVPVLLLLMVPLIILFFASFFIGKYPIPPQDVVMAFAAKIFHTPSNLSPTMELIIFQVRLPRILAAILVGAALSVAGASFQGLFRNPLVSPDKLGVSAGAGFGACLAILLSMSAVMIQFSALLGGLLAVALTYSIARAFRGVSVLKLVLCGIAMETFFAALIATTKYVADPYGQLQSIVFWLMGSLAKVTNQDVIMIGIPIAAGTIVLLMVRWRINLLSMGEDEAKSLGIDIRKMQALVIGCCTLITASAVSISGIIGWIGLVIPHVARMIVGPDHKVLLPSSIILGAFFLLLIDDVARSLTTIEIPLGILTAMIGAPFFLYLLSKAMNGWSRDL